MNTRTRIAVMTLVLALAGSAIPAQAQIFKGVPQFSADMTTKHGGESTHGKIYFGGSRMRFDSNAGGHEAQMINDMTTHTSYVIMPQQQMYMEFSATGPMPGRDSTRELLKPIDPNNPCANEQGATCKKLGTETVNGRSCDKWEVMRDGNKGTVWIDQKLHFPIKTVTTDGTSVELTNIKEGTQPASLFEVPAGYQKMDMGGMMRRRQ